MALLLILKHLSLTVSDNGGVQYMIKTECFFFHNYLCRNTIKYINLEQFNSQDKDV